jgi:asparagine synthase (glutamine-hydrolysing)
MKGLAGMLSGDQSPAAVEIAGRMRGRLSRRSRARGSEARPDAGVSLWQLGPGAPGTAGLYTAVVDGFFYNRTELAARVNLPRDAHEPEILAALLNQYGPAGLEHINGDFAAAAYDSGNRRLYLCRDRFGIRPLYYARFGNDVVFASEVKALAAHPSFRPEPEPTALFDYLAVHYRYIHRDPERTYWRGVRRVAPAAVLILDSEGEEQMRYWRLRLDEETAGLGRQEAGSRLLELMRDSTARRVACGPACCFSVSSGMDSSSVCSLAVEAAGRPQPVYSIGYGGGEYDEAEGIAPLTREKASFWRNLVLDRPPLMETVQRMVRLADGPVCTVTWLAHRALVNAAAEDGYDVIFSGLGGDECLAGEYEHFLFFFADLRAAGLTDRLEAEIEGWVRLHDHPVFRKSKAVARDAVQRLTDPARPGRVLLDQRRYRRYFDDLSPDFIAAGQEMPVMDSPYSGYLVNRCWQDLAYETTPPSLAADEANVSARGMFSRFPFLDHRVVEFCYSLPGTIKYDRGVTKALWRKAMRGILPEANIVNTVKTGFNAPLNRWLAGPDRADTLDLIHSHSFRQRGWFKPGRAEQLFRDHLAGRDNHMMLFWQIINAELWLRSLGEFLLTEAA